jgi:hypothetical protein
VVIVQYYGNGKVLLNPSTPLQALLIAEAHVRAIGYPHLSPLDLIKSASKGESVHAGFLSGAKLTLKEVLPGLRLRAGASEIEVIRVRPTEREVTYKTRGKFIKMDSQHFLNLANQQGYRKIWDLRTFLLTLKSMLKPLLAAVPLMWVLKLVSNAVRGRPLKFESTIPTKEDGKLSSTTVVHHNTSHKPIPHQDHNYHTEHEKKDVEHSFHKKG